MDKMSRCLVLYIVGFDNVLLEPERAYLFLYCYYRYYSYYHRIYFSIIIIIIIAIVLLLLYILSHIREICGKNP